jgi:hypothetical protein
MGEGGSPSSPPHTLTLPTQLQQNPCTQTHTNSTEYRIQKLMYIKLPMYLFFKWRLDLTLSLTGVGPIGPSPSYMQISLKLLKVRYRQKLGIPQAGS